MIHPLNPTIIQGGMGVGVSDWRLARAVSTAGQLGVVSGTALDLVFTRRLQLGDPGGHVRRAVEAFPQRDLALRVYEAYHIPGGKAAGTPFKAKPLVGQRPPAFTQQLLMVANFVEVYLAKEGHDGGVGINFLEKIQSPMLPSLYGAMLAGVDAVLMGAGIPRYIPGILDLLAEHQPVEFKLQVSRETTTSPEPASHTVSFDPRDHLASEARAQPLRRPAFLPIVSAAALASMLVKKSNGRVDGLIIEGPTAGGHNSPPRVRSQFNDRGEPLYGPRDIADLDAIKALGLPFWLAGSYGHPEGFAAAQAAGATGIQIGTLFAFCEESGITPEIKQQVIALIREGHPDVFTDPNASPTGFPFKVLALPQSHSDAGVTLQRGRVCDLGYLREAYEKPDGTLGWRCPAEDPADYARKGGDPEDTAGRKCICNALTANIGLPQTRADGSTEAPLITCGEEIHRIRDILGPGRTTYTACDVIDYLLASECSRTTCTPVDFSAHERTPVL